MMSLPSASSDLTQLTQLRLGPAKASTGDPGLGLKFAVAGGLRVDAVAADSPTRDTRRTGPARFVDFAQPQFTSTREKWWQSKDRPIGF